ncbi:hypothetical protein [Nocardia terpenica]|uniref:hypothetical protein n=1 Tax=Nocardia terpenica TaxID=455432 RepID=UPI000B088D2E|nr:hypothetical protein [Nocardia terpenica]NQE89761.1 hypothetical protein [Nocardia terpenica]
MNVIREYANGAKVYEIDSDTQFGVSPDGRIYWATSEGWVWVMKSDRVIQNHYKILGDSTGWPTVGGTEYYYLGTE